VDVIPEVPQPEGRVFGRGDDQASGRMSGRVS